MRLALFTALPVLLGAAIAWFDRSAKGPVRRAEAFLIPLFLVGVGGSGLSAFISRVFVSGPGGPYQVEIGFAYLALGILGAVSAERRDGFRVATVTAATVMAVGAICAHLVDAVAFGGVTPGLVGSVAGLVTPVLLIWFLRALRRAEAGETPTIVLKSWMIPVRRGSVVAVAVAALAFPLGYATGQVVLLSLAGMAVAAVAFWWIVSRAPSHRVGAEE